jgi:hypothetical protein
VKAMMLVRIVRLVDLTGQFSNPSEAPRYLLETSKSSRVCQGGPNQTVLELAS